MTKSPNNEISEEKLKLGKIVATLVWNKYSKKTNKEEINRLADAFIDDAFKNSKKKGLK